MLRAAVLLLAGGAAALAAELRMVTPPGSGVHQTAESEMEIAGSLSDAATIRKVEWASSTGAHGEIEPSVNWRAFRVPLAPGPNQLTVTATDRRGFAIQQSVLVFRSSAPPPVGSFEEGVAEWEGRRIPYRVVDGLAIAFGDIVLGRADEVAQASTKNSHRDSSITPRSAALWPDAVVAYVLDSSLTPVLNDRVTQAIAHWQALTPVRFVARTNETSYVRIRRVTSGCRAIIGRGAGETGVFLEDNCNISNVVHEFGHTVGLWHEQERQDARRWIETLYENIQKVQAVQFDFQLSSMMDAGPYDYSSVMQYPQNAFSRDGSAVFRTLPPGIPIRGAWLSPVDIDTVKRMYGRPASAITIVTNPRGLKVVVDGRSYDAEATFVWPVGSSHTVSAPSPQGSGATRQVVARWSNDGPPSQTIVSSAPTTVYVANFAPQCRVTFAAPDDPATGTLTVDPLSPDDYYPCDSEITVAATPAPGYFFYRWSDAALPSANPLLLRTNVARTLLRPVFSKQAPVTVRTAPASFPVEVDGVTAATPQNYLWTPGSSHRLRVTETWSFAETRYRFQQWSQGGSAAQTVTAPLQGTLTATFIQQFHLTTSTVSVKQPVSVAALPDSNDGYYDAGAIVRITAVSSPGNPLRYWSGDLRGPETSQSVTMDQDRLVTANFNLPGPLRILAWSPATLIAGSPMATLAVHTAYTADGLTEAYWNGNRHPARVVSSDALEVPLTAADLARAGPAALRLVNPGFGVAEVEVLVNAPSGDCAITGAPNPMQIAAVGGAAVVSVAAAASCPWWISSDSPWIRTPYPIPYTGNGAATVWVAPLGSSQGRNGTLRVGGQAVLVSQSGVPCAPVLTPASVQLSATGGSGSVQVLELVAGCDWTVSTDAPWISLTSPPGGTGSGVVRFTAAANGSAVTRESVLRIGGQTVRVSQAAAVNPRRPVISAGGVVNGASFASGIASATWVAIQGANLAPVTRTWAAADFGGNRLPQQLDGVRVNLNGKPAYVYFISPGQINVLAPDDPAEGPVQVEVVTPEGTSAPVVAQKQNVAPALFLFQGKWAAAVHADGALAGKPGLFDGLTTRPVKPGETILLFGTGFGPTNPALPAGEVVAEPAPLVSPVAVRIGGMTAATSFAGLTGSGLYQFNVIVPEINAGDHPVEIEIDGVRTQSNVLLTVQGTISWDFERGTEGWTPINMAASRVSEGIWFLDPAGDDPYLVGPAVVAPASDYAYVKIRAAIACRGTAAVFFRTAANDSFSEARKVVFESKPCPLCGDAPFETYSVFMGSHQQWSPDAVITRIRLDPCLTGVAGSDVDRVLIDYIRLSPAP